MTIRLIYHGLDCFPFKSPFDEEIDVIAKGNDLRIACPYITIDYIEKITRLSFSWRLIADVEEWLKSLSKRERKKALEFMSANIGSIRHFSNLHAKVVFSEKSALIGSANLTEAGIYKRTEMAVVIGKESTIKELQCWFDEMWRKSLKLPPKEKIALYIEGLPAAEAVKTHKLFPSIKDLSPPRPSASDSLSVPPPFGPKMPLEPIGGKQYEIVDALLAAYPYNKREIWLSADHQVKLLQKVYDAKLYDGRNAFPAMHGGAESGDSPPGKSGRANHWTGDNRINRMNVLVKQGVAIKGFGLNYMLSEGVTPEKLGVSQSLVNALASFEIIAHYDVKS